VLEVWRDI